MDGGRGSCGRGDAKKIRYIRRGKVVDGLECIQEDFEINSEFDKEPVELL